MGWETRKRGGRYYCRSTRVGGKIVRLCFGTGQKGEAAALRDAAERAERARLRILALQMEAEQKARQEALEGPLRELDEVCRLLMRTVLETAGYHRPKRWKWRRRCVTDSGR